MFKHFPDFIRQIGQFYILLHIIEHRHGNFVMHILLRNGHKTIQLHELPTIAIRKSKRIAQPANDIIKPKLKPYRPLHITSRKDANV